MKISNKASYPYPIWGWRDDYSIEMPQYSIDDVKFTDKNNYGYELTLVNSNSDIDALIEEQKAEYICVVDCPSTGMHWYFESYSPQFHFTIPRNEVNKKIEFKWMIVAKEAIAYYESESLNKDYAGHASFPKGAMIAYITSFEVYPDVTEGVHCLDDIIAVVKNTEDAKIKYLFDQNQIRIALPEEQLQTFTSNHILPEVLHSTIVYTALIKALSRIHRSSETLDWVDILKQYIDPVVESEGIPSFEELDSTEDNGYNVDQCMLIADYILQDPFMRMFKEYNNTSDETEHQ